MTKIDAYKCDYTGSIYEDQQEAARCEFRALMQKVAGPLPCLGSVEPKNIMHWLAEALERGPYVSAGPLLMDALLYLRDHREMIAGDHQ